MPLSVSVISSEENDGTVLERLYFSGERTAMGVTRVYARLYIPPEKKPPVVIVMDDFSADIADFDARPLTDKGYAVLIVDYAGACDKERYTIYPKALDFADYFKNPEQIETVPNTVKQNCWYVWTTVLLRALTFVESDGRLSDEIGLLGVGGGVNQVLKVAALENVKCAVAMFSPGPVIEGADTDINFKALLDNSGYVPLCKIPVLNVVGSNDEDGYFDRLGGVCLLADGEYYMTVGERLGKALTPRQTETVRLWLGRHLKMGMRPEMSPPELSARQSERLLYYEINAGADRHVSKAELFVSYSETDCAHRNWRKVIPLLAGTGDYIAKVPVYDPTKPIYAFGVVTYEGGFVFSTPLLVKTPALLGVSADKLVKSRLLYDSDSGTDDFISPRGGDNVRMEEGAYSIMGVCSLDGELATYKIGDMQYRAERDSILQLIVYSEKPQTAEFVVRVASGDEIVEYVCKKKIERDANWTKLTLGTDDFKSKEGTLMSFADAVYFCVRADKLLINTMLWV